MVLGLVTSLLAVSETVGSGQWWSGCQCRSCHYSSCSLKHYCTVSFCVCNYYTSNQCLIFRNSGSSVKWSIKIQTPNGSKRNDRHYSPLSSLEGLKECCTSEWGVCNCTAEIWILDKTSFGGFSASETNPVFSIEVFCDILNPAHACTLPLQQQELPIKVNSAFITGVSKSSIILFSWG